MALKVSIIIPAYNVEEYISECLNSVLAQTFSAWEAIVIDDGSTDRTLAMVSMFNDARIKLLKQENVGLSASRNRGIKLAKGDFVLCLDSDDRLHPDALQTCFDLAQKHDLDAVTFDGYDFKSYLGKEKNLRGGYFDRSKKLEEGKYGGKEFMEKEVFKKAVVVSAPLYFVKREKLRQVPFEEGMLHEDVLFHYNLLPLLDSIYYLPKKYYQRRLREGSIVHTTPSLKSLEAYQKIIVSLELKYRDAMSKEEKLYRKIIEKNMLQLGKLGKRYLLTAKGRKQRAVVILKQVLCSGKMSLIFKKSVYFMLGFIYYLFADLRSR